MFKPIARGAHAAKRHWRKGAVVTAVAATAVAFSGTGVAVAHGLIDSGRIQNQTIRSVDIGQNQVGASELRPGDNAAVRTEHLRDNGIRPHDLGNNFQADATNELEGYEIVGSEESLSDGGTVDAECPEGLVAIGGGGYTEGAGTDSAVLTSSGPVVTENPDGTGTASAWQVVARGDTGSTQVGAYVICASNVENTFDD